MVKTSRPYKKRNDLEKICSQWKKATGLHSRDEWSAAIVRVATAAEIAANFAIRKEFKDQTKLGAKFINSLLRWANGLGGKFDRLLIPITTDNKKRVKIVRGLKAAADEINSKRNAIVHQGEFCSEKQAKKLIKQAYKLILELVRIYEPNFTLQ